MATTHVPDPGPIDPEISLEEILKTTHEMLLIAQGDEDKAGTIEDMSYYEGWADALEWVEGLITVQPDKE